MAEDDGGWERVTRSSRRCAKQQQHRRRRGDRRNPPPEKKVVVVVEEEEEEEEETQRQRILSDLSGCSAVLREVDFFHRMCTGLADALEECATEHQGETKQQSGVEDNRASLSEIVCYGIGNFANGGNALTQLSCAVLLREHFSAERLYVFDPVLTPVEKSVLSYLGCDVMEANEQGKRRVSERPALFFMPHCPMRLYSNLLWANWGERNLRNVFIIGNSFESYDLNMIDSRHRRDPRNCIARVLQFTREVKCHSELPKMVNDYGSAKQDVLHRIATAFNQTSVIYFPPPPPQQQQQQQDDGGSLLWPERPPEWLNDDDDDDDDNNSSSIDELLG